MAFVRLLILEERLRCGGHSTSINACRVWVARAGVQVSRREFHTHIHLDYVRLEILSCIKKVNNQ